MDLTDENIVKKSNDIQKGEMEKHKWFLSELVHRDMGSAALIDWTNLYAKQWRESFKRGVSGGRHFPDTSASGY